MDDKTIIDLFDSGNKITEENKQKIKHDFFQTSEEKKGNKINVDVVSIAMKLMSNPNLIKRILIIVGIFSIIGIVATIKFIFSMSLHNIGLALLGITTTLFVIIGSKVIDFQKRK